jgi:anti-sigma regulatory factor (Ser/Thr protein kinase)
MGTLNQTAHRRQTIREPEDVGALRRAVAAMTSTIPGVQPGDGELVATELATNLIRHTSTGGYVLYRQTGNGIELVAVDYGPGMPPTGQLLEAMPFARTPLDWAARLPTGLNAGLASIERVATMVDFFSTSSGTVVLARIGEPWPSRVRNWRWGAVNIPQDGVGESGDAWAVTADQRLAALVVDGLGHGPGAADAARAAISTFNRGTVSDLMDFMGQAHEAMRTTRGGVLGVCTIDAEREELTFAGVGNITGRVLLGDHAHHLISHAGTVGTQLSPPHTDLRQYPWGPGATLVLASDGIRTHWDPLSYPGLVDHDPAVIAATLHRDHDRAADDAAVLVIHDTRNGAR